MDVAPTLRYQCLRYIALLLFQNHIRWRRLLDVCRSLQEHLRDLRIPPMIREDIHQSIGEILREVQRWGEKHAEMFDFYEKPKMRERAHRSEHLRTFYWCIQWKGHSYQIDDLRTAEKIMTEECARWPQMKFQFACAYAMREIIEDDFLFDKYRIIAFKKRLADHPVYDFWLAILDGKWEQLFNMEGRTPNQKLMLCFRFAITHGYFELVQFFWNRISPQHREYMGLLQWRSVCFRPRSRETVQFLCKYLCEVNAVSVARITWTTFYDALYKSIHNEDDDPVIEKKNLNKLQFLLENCCPTLKERLLSMENFRVVTDAFRYNQAETFSLFLENLSREQLPQARERVDRIHDKARSRDGAYLQQLVLRRQQTVD